MQVKSLLFAGFGAFTLALLSTAAHAGPIGLAGAIDHRGQARELMENELVEKVTWYGDSYYGRYHHPHYGYRWYHHRYYGHPHYGYRWYGHRHEGWYPRYG